MAKDPKKILNFTDEKINNLLIKRFSFFGTVAIKIVRKMALRSTLQPTSNVLDQQRPGLNTTC
jgi:hypothetical protein